MHITKEELLQDPYKACEDYNKDPETEHACDKLFCDASNRLASFSIYGNLKPSNEAIILDIWDYYTDEERHIMQEANHPFWQAVQEITQQNSDN